ncbi:cyclin-J-like protein isoform X1 [Monodelphis domestica]|uniref:cyclin-J-like protein isoform X1 n=2 Tax=Monodelphis domestica TaxID=13616 RepID=UPI00028BD51B|nr:cyclin-J-like protein isoform X1 [Monodelphis domestica]
MDERWWEGHLALDIHCTLREKELKLPVYKAQSPLLESRRYFVDLVSVLSNHCKICPTARHLAVYLLDLFMDRYSVTAKQLHIVAIACLLLASKFEEKEDRVPKLEQMNSLGLLCSHQLVLSKKELLQTELLLLEAFGWNLCMPTPAHYVDYYLLFSLSEKDLCNNRPIFSFSKTKGFLEKYVHYFLEVSLQDHIFHNFPPSMVAAACIWASRICLQLSPTWTRDLEKISHYSMEQISACVKVMLLAFDNDFKDANKVKNPPLALQSHMLVPGTHQAPTQVLFQQPAFHHPVPQPAATLSHIQTPVQDLCSAYRDTLQPHQSGGLLSGSTGPSLYHPYSALQPSAVQAITIPGPLPRQIGVEPRHCISMAYGSSYFSGHHSFPAGCLTDKVKPS